MPSQAALLLAKAPQAASPLREILQLHHHLHGHNHFVRVQPLSNYHVVDTSSSTQAMTEPDKIVCGGISSPVG